MTPPALRIADDFTLPLEAATETFAILARRGMGKSFAAAVLAEEMVGAGLPVCIIDPTGAHWGLRSSADGKAAGLPVVIFGGDHADLPLDAHGGAMVAEILKDGRFPAILDLSLLSKSDARRFVADFAETLYRVNREPLHIVIDECDLFMPQRVFSGMERLVGAMDDVVRRGRIRGLGVTLISQRPAVVNKDVLSQVGALIVLGMTGRHDIGAIDDWVSLHADPDEARTVKSSLAALKVGEAWVWSPGWLGVLQRIRIRRRRTFDSSATPKPGMRRVEPKEWAKVDLDTLRTRLASLGAEVEEVGTSDPKRLRAEVVRLRRALTEARTATHAASRTVEVPVEVKVEVPVLESGMADHLRSLTRQLDILGVAVNAVLDRYAGPNGAVQPAASTAAPTPTRQPKSAPQPTTSSHASGDVKLGKAERAILTVLAQHGRSTITQVALLTGYSSKGGGFSNALSRLRTLGFMTGRGEFEATPEGLAALGAWEPLPTGTDLVAWWQRKVGKAAGLALGVLVEAWPHEVPVDEIASRTGYAASGGGFSNALSRLRSLDLASGRGALRVADPLGEAWRH